ncbi:MAG: tellurite resistance TerB family protein, partial [Phycisphaerales bacterium]|nr:tellurite resistance TerB family protein [Phycisphaerales bacterium]
MNSREQEAVVTVCLLAAFADGGKSDSEREEVRRIVESLGSGNDDAPAGAGGPASRPMSALYQDVLLGRVTVEKAVQPLTQPAHRTLAYEMAVAVCDADGRSSPEEKVFLEKLRATLAIEQGAAAATLQQADELVDFGLEPAIAPAIAGAGIGAAALAAGSTGSAGALAATGSKPAIDDAEIDASITRYAILNAAIEL